MYITNQCEENRSRNRFARLFWDAIMAMGSAVETVSEEDQQMNEELTRLTQRMTHDECKMVADAPNMTAEEVAELHSTETKTHEQKCALRKYALCKLYGVEETTITPNFVETYGNAQVQAVYRNLSALKCFEGETVRSAAMRRVKCARQFEGNTSYATITSSVSARLLYEALTILEHLNVDLDRDHIEGTTMPTKMLEGELNALADDFSARAEFLSHLFSASKEAFDRYASYDFQYKLRFVSSLMTRVFGMRLVGLKRTRSKKSRADTYEVKMSPWFEWAGDHWTAIREKEEQVCALLGIA